MLDAFLPGDIKYIGECLKCGYGYHMFCMWVAGEGCPECGYKDSKDVEDLLVAKKIAKEIHKKEMAAKESNKEKMSKLTKPFRKVNQ